MIEYIVIAGVVIFIIAILLIPKSDRHSYNPRDAKQAEAMTSMVFLENDMDRAIEYEHRFSGSRTGMVLNRRGYRVRKRR